MLRSCRFLVTAQLALLAATSAQAAVTPVATRAEWEALVPQHTLIDFESSPLSTITDAAGLQVPGATFTGDWSQTRCPIIAIPPGCTSSEGHLVEVIDSGGFFLQPLPWSQGNSVFGPRSYFQRELRSEITQRGQFIVSFAQPVSAFAADFTLFSALPGSVTTITLSSGETVAQPTGLFLGFVASQPFSNITFSEPSVLSSFGHVVLDNVAFNAPVPEPGAAWLLAGGLAVLLSHRRLQRRTAGLQPMQPRSGATPLRG